MTLGPLMIDLEGPVLGAGEAERLRDPLVGGVILFARNFSTPEQLRALTAAIHGARTPPLLIAVDQEGGRVQRFRTGFYRLPPLRWFGHQHDLEPDRGRRLAFLGGWLMAAELLDVGVDFSFAPVVDLDYGTSEVIGDRSFHRDPEVVTTLALAYLQGMRRSGMAATAKHFPGHGLVVADSHRELPVDARTLPELYDDLLPYQGLVANGLAGTMVAHVRYPNVDHRVASLSPAWIRGELRGSLGFRGVVFTDDLSMSALEGEGDMATRARLALDAGADMALICNAPGAAAEACAALAGHADPASQGRLLQMRPRPAVAGPLRADPAWIEATAELDAALERPPLALDG